MTPATRIEPTRMPNMFAVLLRPLGDQMSLRNSDLKMRLTRFTDRRQMPKRIEGKEFAIADEVSALLAAIERSAPRDPDAISEWWAQFATALGEAAPTYWPTEKDIRDAVKTANAGLPKLTDPMAKPDPIGWTARAMNEGRPVGEHWLWGVSACDLIATGQVSRETMTAYRSGAFFNRRDVYGESAAKAWEDDRKRAHDLAKDAYRHRAEPRHQRSAAIPDKSAAYQEYIE